MRLLGTGFVIFPPSLFLPCGFVASAVREEVFWLV